MRVGCAGYVICDSDSYVFYIALYSSTGGEISPQIRVCHAAFLALITYVEEWLEIGGTTTKVKKKVVMYVLCVFYFYHLLLLESTLVKNLQQRTCLFFKLMPQEE